MLWGLKNSPILRRNGVPLLRDCDPLTGEIKQRVVRGWGYGTNAPGQESYCIWTSRNWRPYPPAEDGRCTGGETSPNWEWATRSRASVVDDHNRLAYSEALPDEKAPTVVGFAIRALEFYRQCGVTHIEELMTDNHWIYTHSLAFKALLTLQGIKHLTIKPQNPQQNGKAERYHQTLKPS